MKVKIGNYTYDSASIPIILVLTQKDKENILGMPKDNMYYASFPWNFDPREIEEQIMQMKSSKKDP